MTMSATASAADNVHERTMNAIANIHVVELNEANFAREVLGASSPVLVGFWASWSDPCRTMAAMMESVAGNQSVAVKVGRVNVEAQEELTEQCGVRVVPTLLLFNQGRLRDQIVGRVTEHDIREKLERLT